jgi:hypothetical protein
MTEQLARNLLGIPEGTDDMEFVEAGFNYIHRWNAGEITLDGKFNLLQLKAVVWWMENKR